MASLSCSDDQRLPKSRILRGRENFNRLFQGNGVKIYRGRYLNFRFRLIPEMPDKGCQVGFIVKTSLGKAADRNYAKRLMREVYRKKQRCLCDRVHAKNAGFHGAFSTRTLDLDYERVNDDVTYLLDKTFHFIDSSRLVD